jgi:hypothetical protein
MLAMLRFLLKELITWTAPMIEGELAEAIIYSAILTVIIKI